MQFALHKTRIIKLCPLEQNNPHFKMLGNDGMSRLQKVTSGLKPVLLVKNQL